MSQSEEWLEKAHDQLTRFVAEPLADQSLVLSSGERYLVFRLREATQKVQVIVSAGRQLSQGSQWTPEQEQSLFDGGLRRSRASEDYRATTDVQDVPQKWAALLAEVVETHLELGPAAFEVEPQREHVTEIANLAIEEAMEFLAKERNWQARTGLYRLLIEGALLVLTKEVGPVYKLTQTPRWNVIDVMGSMPVMAVFTSTEALFRYAPTGAHAMKISGRDLFPLLVREGAATLRMNPGGMPRGELFRNELDMIVEGIKRLDGVH